MEKEEISAGEEAGPALRDGADRAFDSGIRPGPLQTRAERVGKEPVRRRTFPLDMRVPGLLTAAELFFLLLWTLFITAPYLNFDPARSPAGSEFQGNIQTHHVWTWLTQCGSCAFWFGGANGGWPVAADVNAATLHPLIAGATLFWGVVNGSKVALAAAFLMAGLAQWWLARALGVGRIGRTWSACLAVAAGHLATRMDLGSISMVLSTASAAFVWPPIIALCRGGRRRDAVWLGIALGLLVLSGNGYMQVGTAFLLPVTLLLIRRERVRLASLLGLAAGIAILIAAPVLLPFVHFLPEFNKALEPTFPWSQPFGYVPLNLVISDHSFYLIKALGHEPYSAPYALFVGWVPVLLGLWGLGGHRAGRQRRETLFLASLAVIAFWLASAAPFRLLLKALPLPQLIGFLSGVRNTAFMAGLAVPPILALSAIGLDRLLDAPWPGLVLAGPGPWGAFVGLRWLLAIPLIWALLAVREFGKSSIRLVTVPPYVPSVLAALKTEDLQWVSTPLGEQYWIGPAVSRGMKLGENAYLTWEWRGRHSPLPVLAATNGETPSGMAPQSVVNGIRIFSAPPGREYASVLHRDGTRTVCTAHGVGGNIDVLCDAPSPGALTVLENSWSGWKARTASGPVTLRPGPRLAVNLPAGRSVVQFRYRPWDLPLGLLLCVGGIALCVREIARDRRSQTIVLPRSGLENPLSAPSQTLDLPATRSDP